MYCLRVLAALCLALGCAQPEKPQELTLRIAVPGDLAPFHPRATSTYTAAATDLVYQPVLRVGGRGQFLPVAVRSWERLAADRIRLHADPDRRFSDGSPVRVEDLVSSLSASGLEVRPTGEWLDIGPGSSRGPLEATLLYTSVFKDAVPVPLGTGPYVFVEGDARHLVLRRLRPAPGRVARVEILAAPTPRDAFAWALRGEANVVLSLDDRQSELIDGVPGLRIVRGEGPHAVSVVMNAARFSREERRSLAASLPLSELVRAYGGGCDLATSAGRGEAPPPGRPLLVAAVTYDAGLPRMALALRRGLGSRGGEVATDSMGAFIKRASARDFDLAVASLLVWPPVMLGGIVRAGAVSNLMSYSNPEVDAAFDRGDVEAALVGLERDPPFVIVCRRQRIAAVDARIRNPSLGTWGVLETLPDWEVGP